MTEPENTKIDNKKETIVSLSNLELTKQFHQLTKNVSEKDEKIQSLDAKISNLKTQA